MKTSIYKYLIRFGNIPFNKNNVMLSETKHRRDFLKLVVNYRKILISFMLILGSIPCFATTYASLSPVPTEIIYALNAQDNLVGVSTTCNFPEETKEKPIIGDTYFVNMEMMVKLKPDYLFTMSSAKPMLGQLAQTKTKPIYFEFTKIEEIYDAINYIAKLTNTEENAPKLIADIKTKVEQNKTKNPKKILYIVQTEPLITIGNKSFITDIIEKSGHKSVTADIEHYYPNITLEYVMKMNPDVVIICFPTKAEKIKELLPNAQFYYLTEEQRDIINRSGPRVYDAVKLFAELDLNKEITSN